MEIVVRTSQGLVAGLVDNGVRTWRGVPFGADTSGKHRWRAPRAAHQWRGVRDCTAYGPIAPQPIYSWTDQVQGSEDCLNLDIVRPDSDDELPVVVYLHGGSFIVGASHQSVLQGHTFVKNLDVVYVSINFRLGALGYLNMHSVGEGDCVANPAIRDQLLALQWVHENIAAFGGDPTNVTLMGESAGGAAVTTLMCVPSARGLFHRAIAQSAPIAAVHSAAQSEFWARELAYHMAMPRHSSITDLRLESADDVVRAGQSMMWRSREFLQLNPCYCPTVDGSFVLQHPVEAFNQGNQVRVPLLIGTNRDETSFSKLLYLRQSARGKAAQRMLNAFDPSNTERVLSAYWGAVERQHFSELLCDALFWAPSLKVAQAHSRVAPTWMYRFDFAPKALKMLGIGAMHSLELLAVFGDADASRTRSLARWGGDGELEEVTEFIQYLWGNFIHVGSPGWEWPRYQMPTDIRPGRATMIFNTESELVFDPRAGRRKAWSGFNMLEWDGVSPR